MARNNYNHTFQGVLGDKVYFKRADEYFARIRVNEVKASQSDEAVERRLQFGTIGKLGKAMKYVTTSSFPNRPKRETATNTFVRLNYGCCTVSDGTATIDYPSLKFSDGQLRRPTVSMTYLEEEHSLSFTVTPPSKVYAGCWATDRVCAVLLDEEYNQAMFEELGTRGDGGMVTVALDEQWAKENVHVYVFCVTEDGKDVSPTTYMPIE